jgi:anti-sigma factor RsiW
VRHDPDRLAAEFLSGDLAGARRRLVERHLLDCEECWREVAQARRGRQAAEALRLVTPPQVRDRIRAVVDLDSPIPRSGRTSGTVPSAAARRVLARPHLRWLPRPALAAALLTLSTAVVAAMVVFTRPGPDQPGRQPAVVAALVQAYRHDQPQGDPTAAAPPTRQANGFVWTQARRIVLVGQPIILHEYRRANGTRILLARAQVEFPRATGAHNLPGGEWQADIGGIRVYCTARPGPTLVLGNNPDAVAALAHASQ